ncbi:GNAT family N-acetyltransferase [Actinomadura madurae]|uniref:GNAT family N-acetyltransferase n=1 Tax=Actinomadura madurae TaxID=1993 RepID=UPI0020D2611B|nr:GNAT family N-acetyltransferase [Actinomadura madurae]MCP9949873.1 GNAT family N-acetyltransferase [Actinomadura madurae]MCP9966624.1 GNAT family N-acetyltransferase [Actinomadura madurae]MCP9979115.1 GNAT family N-acetyltransferase [Actinomadura madurae]MCQ0009355.1 GNAT family N-acetyltransferase [Actinomadura madurae]MCQ0015303.1 GNAT family N-acetyltransferase [Actinomadura madurae]
MTADVDVRGGAAKLAEKHFSSICQIHDAVFSQPPFAWVSRMSDENADYLRRLMADPTFGLVLAEHGGGLVGYAFGHRLPIDHGWWTDFTEPLPEDLTAEWQGRTFALISLALLPRWRGRGLGERVVRHLLADRDEERAILSVQPTALATQGFYRHLGWREVGRKGPLQGVVPPYWDIFVLPRMNSL